MKNVIENDEDKLIHLKKKIENLDKSKQIELFNRLNKKNVLYSENRNGIFINMNEIPKEIIEEMIQFTNYLEHQDQFVEEQENEKRNIQLSLHK